MYRLIVTLDFCRNKYTDLIKVFKYVYLFIVYKLTRNYNKNNYFSFVLVNNNFDFGKGCNIII